VQYHPYSDFALHHMGSGLSDGVSQGAAGPDEFRSAPLWGLGQRLFFLHDGRTSDLNSAIQAHAGRGSEANTVVGRFNRLSRSQRQSVLDFLRSL
ncbi:MAG TPA: di-heme oxidoredictase family protein, partial [Terriglobales bacterium]